MRRSIFAEITTSDQTGTVRHTPCGPRTKTSRDRVMRLIPPQGKSEGKNAPKRGKSICQRVLDGANQLARRKGFLKEHCVWRQVRFLAEFERCAADIDQTKLGPLSSQLVRQFHTGHARYPQINYYEIHILVMVLPQTDGLFG